MGLRNIEIGLWTRGLTCCHAQVVSEYAEEISLGAFVVYDSDSESNEFMIDFFLEDIVREQQEALDPLYLHAKRKLALITSIRTKTQSHEES